MGFIKNKFLNHGFLLARFAAAQCFANHHVRTVRPDALELLPEMLARFGEPYGDSSAVAAWLAHRHKQRQG